jgi:hypothetical protein
MIQTIFGVHLPPRRKKRRKYRFTLKFVLLNTVPSKKNRQRARINRGKALDHYDRIMKENKGRPFSREDMKKVLLDIKAFIYHGNEYQAWAEYARTELNKQAAQWHQWKGDRLVFPITNCSINIYHSWKDDLIRDNSNKAETIHDILIEAGVIAGDNWQVMSPNESDADLYRDEINENITLICINCYEDLPEKKKIEIK